MRLSLLMFSVGLSLTLAGCGSKDTSTTTLPDGSQATVTKEGDQQGMTIESNGTQASVGSAAKVTEANLGLPFYPGATMKDDESMAIKTPTEISYLAAFTSSDPIEKIAAFYEEKVKGLTFSKIENAGAVTMISKELMDSRKGKQSVVLLKKSASDPVRITLGWGKTE